MNISEEIKKLMNSADIGVNELARLAGVAPATLSVCSENTKFINIKKILRALGYRLEIKRVKSNAKPKPATGTDPETELGG